MVEVLEELRVCLLAEQSGGALIAFERQLLACQLKMCVSRVGIRELISKIRSSTLSGRTENDTGSCNATGERIMASRLSLGD